MPVRMGNRLDTYHTLVFTTPLTFADVDTGKFLQKADVLKVRDDLDPLRAIKCTDGAPGDWGTSTKVGTQCYTITPVGGVVIASTEDLSNSSLMFQLSSKVRLSSPSIHIDYHVWALSTGVADNAAVDVADTDKKSQGKITYRNTLRLNVHKCVTTDDCPIGEPA